MTPDHMLTAPAGTTTKRLPESGSEFTGIPGLPPDHPLNEFFKNLPKDQETARATPPSPAPNAQSTAQSGWVGVEIQNIDPAMAQALGVTKAEGAIVAEVDASGPGAKKLKTGDAILEIDRQRVRNALDARDRFAARPPGDLVLMRVLRKGEHLLIAVRLGTWPSYPNTK